MKLMNPNVHYCSRPNNNDALSSAKYFQAYSPEDCALEKMCNRRKKQLVAKKIIIAISQLWPH